MYYPYFLTYMLAGFVISLIVLVWALNSGQFKDQQRARFIPLQVEAAGKPVKSSRISRIEMIVLFAFACIGLMLTVAVLAFAIIRSPGMEGLRMLG